MRGHDLHPVSRGFGAHTGPLPAVDRRPPRRDRWGRTGITLAWTLFLATVGVQIAFPLTGGGNLALTVASVSLLTAATLTHVIVTRGYLSASAVVVVVGGGGLVAEAVGIRTGFPFGTYDYTDGLGLTILGVPVLVSMAWIMMAWPALVVARRLAGSHGRLTTSIVGACALTAWDVFLDPQMVDQGNWEWRYPTPSLPGVSGIPLTNFAGWLVVSFVMMAILDRVIGGARAATTESRTGGDCLPIAIYLWTYFSSVLAHLAFFGRPPVALTGGILMGAIAIPLVVVLVRQVADARR
ncbi:carotenoid biosynthesis protein [Gordonia soli]|uniref:carotenoid biosynthesis protein n=1 Tax=Gordonia soli TaxID=320799 RepID=UPI000A038B12